VPIWLGLLGRRRILLARETQRKGQSVAACRFDTIVLVFNDHASRFAGDRRKAVLKGTATYRRGRLLAKAPNGGDKLQQLRQQQHHDFKHVPQGWMPTQAARVELFTGILSCEWLFALPLRRKAPSFARSLAISNHALA